MSGWQGSVCLVYLAGLLLGGSTAKLPAPLFKEGADDVPPTIVPPTIEMLLSDLPDGAYQFCTEPDPQDWRDGAGVCLNFVKQSAAVDGYYSYPHSNAFICLRGRVSENGFYGKGFVISWTGRTWSEIPQEAFNWDQEGRLYLSHGDLIHTEGQGEGQVSWIIFQQANLNMQGLYLYDSARMTSPTQLCDWRFD